MFYVRVRYIQSKKSPIIIKKMSVLKEFETEKEANDFIKDKADHSAFVRYITPLDWMVSEIKVRKEKKYKRR